jgi:hypothetical protein
MAARSKPQRDNGETGSYHGYPLLDADPFAEIVRARWNESSDDDP